MPKVRRKLMDKELDKNGVQAEWSEYALQGTDQAGSTKPITLKHS